MPTTASPTPYTFTVQVTDSTLPTSQTQSKLLAIPIQQPQPLSISPSSLPTGATATPYAAALTTSGGIPPYTWTLTSGQLPAGLVFDAATGAITGTPILVGSSTFTVQVADSEVTPASISASYTISIAPGSNSNSLISGQYSFLFNGFDSQGQVTMGGSFATDGNGKITGGAEDSNRVGSSSDTGVIVRATLTGSYSMGTDGRGTMELIATNSVNVAVVRDYDLVLDSNGNIRFFENNATTTNTEPTQPLNRKTYGSGIMRPVTGSGFSDASFSGNYAFVFTGNDLAGARTALAGVVHADGVGNLTTGGGGPNGDYNEAGTFSSQLQITGIFSFDAGTHAVVTLTFELPGKAAYTLEYSVDFVSPSDIVFVPVDPTDATHPRLSGEMILQSPTTPFNSSALSGPSVATGTGLNGTNASVLAGLLTLASKTTPGCAPGVANCVTLGYDENNGGTIASPSFTGNYQITSNGRVAFSNLGAQGGAQRVAVAYLTGPGEGFTLGSDSAVTAGLLEQQETGVTFAASSVEDGYTLSAAFPAENQVNNIIGQVSANGTNSIVGTLDEFTPPSTPNLDQSIVATYGNITAAGRGTITTNSPIGLPTNLAFYIVSPGIFRAIPTDASDQHPEVIFFDH